MKPMKRGLAVLLSVLLIMPGFPADAAEMFPVADPGGGGSVTADTAEAAPVTDENQGDAFGREEGIADGETKGAETDLDAAESAKAGDVGADETEKAEIGETDSDAAVTDVSGGDAGTDSVELGNGEGLAEGDTAKEEGSAAYAETVIDSGTLETGMRWTLDEAGTLTISGAGAMPDYADYGYRVAPWYSDRQSVLNVVIEDGVTQIGENAFYGCSALSSVVIPDSVETIGNRAFGFCHSLVFLSLGNGLKSIGEFAFVGCSALSSIAIPDSVETIGGSAFSRCTSLATVSLGNGLKSIEWYAFGQCSALVNIVIPDSVETIGSWAFAYCTSLATVSLGNGLKTIEACAFDSCIALVAIEIPDSVETIGTGAFGKCALLESVTIGSGVSDLGGCCFGGCEALKEVVINGNSNYLVEDGVIFTNDRATLVEYLPGNAGHSYVVPNSVTEINYGAFANNYALKEVGLPGNLKEIDRWAFAGTGLYEVSIPAQTEIIGEMAFFNSGQNPWGQEIFIYSRNVVIGNLAFGGNTIGSFDPDIPVSPKTDRVPVSVIYGFEGSAVQEYAQKYQGYNYLYEMKFIPIAQSDTEQGLPVGVRYVPYEVSLRSIMGYMQNADYDLVDGALPEGMTLGSDGLITGTPVQTGHFVFTVQRHNGDSAEMMSYLLEVRDNTDVNVEEITDIGYELIEYIPDLDMNKLEQSYTLRSLGIYEEFRNVYLDGRKLEAGTEYTSEAGSTRITIMAQTLAGNGTGIHTIGIEFRTETGRLKRAAQNYTFSDTETPDNIGNAGENGGTGADGNNGSGTGNEIGVGSGENKDAPTESAESVPAALVYIVRPGDTLWKIAVTYYGSGQQWNRIYQDNTAVIRNPNRLRAGQALTIYLDSPGRALAQDNTLQGGTSYTVQAGDSLWKIAARVYGNGNMWRRIYQANQHLIRNMEVIFTRQVFFIPD